VTVTYADSSVLVRAYMAAEPSHARARAVVFGGSSVLTCELAVVEFVSAITRAVKGRRIRSSKPTVQAFDQDCADGGPIILLPLDAANAIDEARRLVTRYGLRTMDAVHLAVALVNGRAAASPEPLHFATFDSEQAKAARAEGLPVV